LYKAASEVPKLTIDASSPTVQVNQILLKRILDFEPLLTDMLDNDDPELGYKEFLQQSQSTLLMLKDIKEIVSSSTANTPRLASANKIATIQQ
jgi:hypothetical protein